MTYTCPLCTLDPLAHSLKKIKETDDIIYYYTCPSQAKLYYDVEGIIKHYNGVLSEIPMNKQWIWIFDATDFHLKHILNPSVGIELAKLISNKFSSNLKKIVIINPTFYIHFTYKIITPFLNKKVLEVIDMDYHSKTSEEIMAKK
jgi:hypothetical protein